MGEILRLAEQVFSDKLGVGVRFIHTGESFTMTYTVTNQGSFGVTPRFRVWFAVGSLIDLPWYVDGLAPGESFTETRTAKLPVKLPTGIYQQYAEADATEDVPESNESNNLTFLDEKITVEMADVELVPHADALANNIMNAGDSFTINNSVVNEGAMATTAGYFVVGIYLSQDTNITRNDINLGYRTIYGLAAGEANEAVTTATIPVSVGPGIYYLGVIADELESQPETDESNNLYPLGPIFVGGTVDLAVSSVGALPTATLYPGSNFTLDNTIINNGTLAAQTSSEVGFYLSLGSLIDTDSILVGTRTITNLGAGAVNSDGTNLTIPSGIPSGLYYLIISADHTNTQPETAEGNNEIVVGTVFVGM